MTIKSLLISGALIIPFSVSYSQDLGEFNSKLPSISIGGGVLPYFGELQENYDITALNHIRTGLHLSVSERFGNYFSASLTGLYGKIAHQESSIMNNPNFETKIMGADISGVFHFDNGKLLSRSAMFAPYLKAGVGYFMFDPYGDLKDGNGNDYHYWSDGTIRTMTESDSTRGFAPVISRDYKYETELTDSAASYSKNTIAIPIGGGAAFRFSRSFEGNIGATFYLSQTDFLDNISLDGKNDQFLYLHAGFTWNMGYKSAKKAQDSRYTDVNFSQLENTDQDGDGVKDMADFCQNTPRGVKVDNKGCPLDSDGDRVPDYRDKEPNSAKGAFVNEDGVTLTDEMMAARAARFDSLAVERKLVFEQNPSLATLMSLDEERTTERSGVAIPEALREADINGDGYISAKEITETIDRFFEGETNFTAERLNDLIDFFFEQ